MGSGFLRDIALRKQLEEKIKEATKNRQLADQEVAAATAMIDGAKGIDAVVTEAEAALADAMSAMSSKDYKAAIERAAEAKERAKRAYETRTKGFLDSTRGILEIAKGLGVEDKEGAQSLQKAEQAYLREGFDEAIDLAKRAWKRSEKTIHEHLSSSFSTAQSLIVTAQNIVIDMASAIDILILTRGVLVPRVCRLALHS